MNNMPLRETLRKQFKALGFTGVLDFVHRPGLKH
jgi:hypothetical protein